MDREEKFRSFRKLERIGAGGWLVLNVIYLVIQGFLDMPPESFFIVAVVYWIGDLLFWTLITVLSYLKKPYEENWNGRRIGPEQVCFFVIILLRALMAAQYFTGVSYLSQLTEWIFGSH